MFESPDEWRRIDEILSAALELPPERRLEFVRDKAEGDEALAEALEELLRADEAAAFFLEDPVDLDARTWLELSRAWLTLVLKRL